MLAAVNGGNCKTWHILLPTFRFGSNKIGVAADPSYDPTDPNAEPVDPTYDDIALYVRLIKKDKIPETSTCSIHPPGGLPSPPPNPLDPGEPDPETDIVEPDNPYCHYRIVKLYETEDPESGVIETEVIYTRYPTNPIVKIEDEGPAPGYSLIEWCYSDDYPYDDIGDETGKVEDAEDRRKMLWEMMVGPVIPKAEGTSEETVNLIDPSDVNKVVTLYVRLRKTKKLVESGTWEIYESQLSRTLHTNNKKLGEGDDSIWGNYKWVLSMEKDFPEGDSLTATGADNKLKIIFKRIGKQDWLEIKEGIHDTTDPKVYSKDGIIEKTITSLTQAGNKFTVTSDGNRKGPTYGMEYVTVTWRGADGYKDLPTLAKFKQKDIEEVYGSENYEIPKAMLGIEDRKSQKKRASAEIDIPMSFSFGIDDKDSDYDGKATSISAAAPPKKTELKLTALDETEFVYEFKVPTHIYFYAGEEKSVASEEPGKVGVKSNATGIIEKGLKEIKFYPYIKMTFMDNLLTSAKKEEQNTQAKGYTQKGIRKETYVLSEHESSILPYDAAELYWYHPSGNDETIKMTSQQWSTHKKATSGSGGWQGPNQVLPGGAIYQIATDNKNPAKVVFNTYNTIVDEKARKEYLTSETTIG